MQNRNLKRFNFFFDLWKTQALKYFVVYDNRPYLTLL